MRLRYFIPLLGVLALGACKDEKKAEPAKPSSSTTAPANPAPENKPAPATTPKPN